MEYIYQKSLYQFLKKEEINKIFINENSKENKEIEIDDILNFFLQNLKTFIKSLIKNKKNAYEDEEKKIKDFLKKLEEKKINSFYR